MGDFSDLSIGLSGLEANQVALDVVGQNVTNANTKGYVDERVNLEAVGAVQHPGFDQSAMPQAGSGAQVENIQRLGDSLLQSRVYTAQGDAGALTAQQQGLQGIQQVFPEPSSNGISTQLTTYWQDWSTLANNPSDLPSRSTVINQGQVLASALNQSAQNLDSLAASTVQNVQGALSTLNTLTSQVAQLDAQIQKGNQTDGSTNELQDQRDQLVSQISSQIGVRVTQNSDGTVDIFSGNQALVSSINASSLSLSNSGPPYSLVWSTDQSTYQPTSGQLGGMLSILNTSIPNAQSNLDGVAKSVMGSVNYLLGTGYDLNGNNGIPFFTGTGARDIAVNPAIISDPSKIAAASTAVPAGGTASSNQDGGIATAIGELPNSAQVTVLNPPSGGTGATTATATEADVAYNQLVSGIGSTTSAVNSQVTAQQSVTSSLQATLQSETGVNTDEELTNMVKFQNAYEASAKYITTVQSVIQSLIAMAS